MTHGVDTGSHNQLMFSITLNGTERLLLTSVILGVVVVKNNNSVNETVHLRIVFMNENGCLGPFKIKTRKQNENYVKYTK